MSLLFTLTSDNSLFIILGLGMLNLIKYNYAVVYNNTRSIYSIVFGILFAIIALCMWTWYGVANSNFLKKNNEISSSSWSTFIGIVTLFIAVMMIPIIYYIAPSTFIGLWNNLNIKYLFPIIISSLILGIIVSWFATLLWNKASRNLPVTLAGQLIVFETISSILYSYLVVKKAPNLFEIIAILLILGGILLAIKITQQTTIDNQ